MYSKVEIPFTKYEGAGNDFILVDNRSLLLPLHLEEFVSSLCDRRFGIGADGLIALQNSNVADYTMRIFNADGKEAEMCGNGLRCFCLYLQELGIDKSSILVETLGGVYPCKVTKERVKTLFPLPEKLLEKESLGEDLFITLVKAGVEHAIIFVDSVEECSIDSLGAFVRYHPKLAPLGANVNFVEVTEKGAKIRTYERGVEGETLACGTGAVATAFVLGKESALIEPRSKEPLLCTVSKEGVSIEGKARRVFSGALPLQTEKLLGKSFLQEV